MLPTTRLRVCTPLAALGALALAGCSDSPTLAGGALPTGVDELAASTLSVIQGGTQEGEVASYLADPVIIEVRSAGGAALTGVPVEWTFSNGRGISASDADYGAADTKMISYTDGSGRSAAAWQLGTEAGQQIASAQIVVEELPTGSQGTGNGNENGKQNQGKADFSAKAKPAKPSSIEVSPDGAVLRMAESMELTAEGIDAYGNPLGDVRPTWRSSDESVATVDGEGRVTSQGPGAATISARVANVSGEATVSVVEEASGVMQKVEGDRQTDRVGDQLATQPTVLVLDESGSPVEGATVSWNVQSGGGRISTSSTQTGSGGRARVTWTLGQVAGRQRLVARASGVPDVTFEATAQPGPIASLEVSPQESSLTVDENLQLEALGLDEYGNSIPNLSLQWRSSATAVATVTSSGIITAVADGSATISASTEGLTAQHRVTVEDATRSLRRVRGNGQTGSAGRRLPGEIAVRLIDGAGSGVSGATVRWRIRTGGGSLSSSSSTTDGSGEASVNWTLGESTGRQEIVAESDGASALVFYANAEAGAVASIEVAPRSSSLTVGGSIQLSVYAEDAYGNTVSNPSVQWTTGASGIATVSSGGRVSARSAGSTTIRATSNGASSTHSVTVGEAVNPGTGEFHEPDDFSPILVEDWNDFSKGWYHTIKGAGNTEIRNGRLIWTYPAGMAGGYTPGAKVVKEAFWHGPYEYQRDEGVTLSSNFHGHHSGVNKFRYWTTGRSPRSPIIFAGTDNNRLTLALNVSNWAMGPKALRWNSSSNFASPTLEQSTVTRGVPHTIESLIYLGTPGNDDGWFKIWLNGVLILDFRNLAILYDGEREEIEQVHFSPVWGGMGDVLPVTQTLSVDRTYVSVKR